MTRPLLLTLICLMISLAQAGQSEFKMITLKHRFAQELLPIVQPMVGQGGTANAVDNHLIIRTSPQRLAEIEQVISRLDVARKNVRIEIRHESSQQAEDSEVAVSGRGRIGDAEVIVGDSRLRRTGANIDLRSGSRETSQRGSEFVTVMDGYPAFIEVGQSIPFTREWLILTQQYGYAGKVTEFQDITTGFRLCRAI